MSAIYQASHDVLPEKAVTFASKATAVSDAIEPIAAQIKLAGNHPIVNDMVDIAEELFLHLREMVRTFNDSATALDSIADDFTRTDDQAAAWFSKHREYLGDPVQAALPTAPEV